jgi:type I restriction enzyme S subunit
LKEVELKDVAEIIAGQSPKSEFYNENGEGVPFFQGKADFGEDYPTVTTWCTKPKKMAKEGDMLFSVRAPVGPTNIAKVDCCIGRGLSAIRPKMTLTEVI